MTDTLLIFGQIPWGGGVWGTEPVPPLPGPRDVFGRIYLACPGVAPTPDMIAAVTALGATPSDAAILAAVLPLMPEGNPPQYGEGAPADPLLLMPGASPVLTAALPAYPTGLPRFQDSNPSPRDGWSIEFAEDDAPGGSW